MAELLEDVVMEKRRGANLRRQSSLALQRSSTLRGSTRLRDAVVYGYIMLRHARQELVRALHIIQKTDLKSQACFSNRAVRQEH